MILCLCVFTGFLWCRRSTTSDSSLRRFVCAAATPFADATCASFDSGTYCHSKSIGTGPESSTRSEPSSGLLAIFSPSTKTQSPTHPFFGYLRPVGSHDTATSRPWSRRLSTAKYFIRFASTSGEMTTEAFVWPRRPSSPPSARLAPSSTSLSSTDIAKFSPRARAATGRSASRSASPG